MTVKKSPIEGSLQHIELGGERIQALFSNGSLLVDNDIAGETGGQRVDIFRLGGEPGPIVVTEDRFRSDARRWGGVRENLAIRDETNTAQLIFTHATDIARLAFDAFHHAVDHGGFDIRKNPENRWELSYLDPVTRELKTCRFEPNPPPADGRLPRFASVILRQGDTEIVVSDEEQLKSLRPQLDPIYRRLLAANRVAGTAR